MASIEEVRAGIAAANEKATEGLGALQQAHASLEEAQGTLMRATEGSGQADVSRRTGCWPRPSNNIDEVRQQVSAAISASKGLRTGCEPAQAPVRERRDGSLGELRAPGRLGERLGEALGLAVTARTGCPTPSACSPHLDGQHSEPLVPARAAPRGRRARPRAAPDQRRRGRGRRHRGAAVSMGRQGRRERITAAFDAFHATMAAVLGAADRLSDAATRAHAEAMVEMWLRADGLDAARVEPRLRASSPTPPWRTWCGAWPWTGRRRSTPGPSRVTAPARPAWPASSPTPRSGPRASPTTGSPSARSSSTAPCRSCGGSAPARSGSAAPSSPSWCRCSTRRISSSPGRRRPGASRRRWSSRCSCGWSATSAPGWCSCTCGTSAG